MAAEMTAIEAPRTATTKATGNGSLANPAITGIAAAATISIPLRRLNQCWADRLFLSYQSICSSTLDAMYSSSFIGISFALQ